MKGTSDWSALLPALRQVDVVDYEYQGRLALLLVDPSGLAPQALLLPDWLREVLPCFDGRHTLEALGKAVTRVTGARVRREQLEGLIRELDQAMMLETPRITQLLAERQRSRDEFMAAPVRAARLAGQVYPAEPEALRAMLDELINQAGSPPESLLRSSTAPRGIICPHIDYARGGQTYARAFQWVRQFPRPDRVILLGVSHAHMQNPFALLDKDFATPLGSLPVDHAAVRQLANAHPTDFFADVCNHRDEHSIELAAVFLHHTWPEPPPRLVPILCGPLGDAPGELAPETDALLAVLRELVNQPDQRTLVLAAVDLAHVGRHFGDPHPLTPEYLQQIAAEDQHLLELLGKDSVAAFLLQASCDDERRRMCGTHAIGALLTTLAPVRSEVLDYAQAVNWTEDCAVTFAAMGFY